MLKRLNNLRVVSVVLFKFCFIYSPLQSITASGRELLAKSASIYWLWNWTTSAASCDRFLWS